MQQIKNMQGKVCLITGATGGIGRITAEALARAGATVVLVGRSAEKTQEVTESIRSNTGNSNVNYLLADLSEQAQVRRLAQEFRSRYDRLHVLVNNAGAVFMKNQKSADGIEMTFALNHLAYFLLTNLLLDMITASAPARIINVSSQAHISGRLNLEDLQNQRSYNAWRAYSQSKLANVYFTYELARRLAGTNVTANALHPGFVATNFGRSNGGFFNPLFRLIQIAAIGPEEGAQTTIYLASSAEVEGVTGKYFDKCRAVPSSRVSYDEGIARQLWEVSARMTGLQEKV